MPAPRRVIQVRIIRYWQTCIAPPLSIKRAVDASRATVQNVGLDQAGHSCPRLMSCEVVKALHKDPILLGGQEIVLLRPVGVTRGRVADL